MFYACGIIGLAIIAYPLTVLPYQYRKRKLYTLFYEWAAIYQYHIVSSKYRGVLKGPFVLSCMPVFRFKILMPDGQERTGWVRLGTFWLGVRGPAEVIWD